MQKTAIEWVKNPDGSQGYSWNPIKGLCPQDCKLPDGRNYCYARKIYQRFKLNSSLSWELDDIEKIEKLQKCNPKLGSRIFTCSTIELFHPAIKEEWRSLLFDIIERNRKYTFIILTKLPQNIDRPMPKNVWLGVSITKENELWRWYNIEQRQKAKLKFISFEPLFEEISIESMLCFADYVNWVIVGCLTGYGSKYSPKREWIKKIVYWMKRYNIPIFLKNNLKEIWGQHLIQELPRGDPR